MDNKIIPFNKPFIVGRELEYIAQAVRDGHLSGDGPFTRRCSQWMEERFGAKKILLTHSCTAALEMAAILCGIEAGDEFIVPSYTFVSTVNAFVLRGARPVFVDIRPDTLNIDETLIERAITERTRAIVPVHYAGVGCAMDAIAKIAARYGLTVVEDAAQGVCSSYRGEALGTIAPLGCYSFHETKNFISGEGGALAINDERFLERAEIIREKGTNRSQFFRGQVDKYTWVDLGSSFLPSELTAAFLYAQLEESAKITVRRMEHWSLYHELLAPLEAAGQLRRPTVPEGCQHNAHMYYVILKDLATRTRLIQFMRSGGIQPVFHYVPLHNSPMGLRLSGGTAARLPVTEEYADRVLRLPCYFEMTPDDIRRVCDRMESFDFSSTDY